ncbi:MAG: transglutaminase-like domain-containing protein [Planctomycetaceae bacterium]|jgi:hypothetical protein|nr:transglutaminase-like domain-containing protein [Planctomycetaceae bacterium]
MQRLFFIAVFLLFVLFSVCVYAGEPETIYTDIAVGNFTDAKKRINQLLTGGSVPPLERWNWNFQKERMNRIEIDFSADKDKVLEHIRRYFPDISPEQLAKWKAEKSLEVMQINGEERYFHAAAANLFRISKEAKAKKQKIDGTGKDKFHEFLEHNTAAIRSKAKESNSPVGIEPRTFKITYTVTVPADTVPAGEVIRCWLPFPHNSRRLTDVKLLESNLTNAVIAPPEYEHATLYGEKVAVKGKDTLFQETVQFKATAESFDLDTVLVKPYNQDSELYKKYTAERETHIIFTPEIKALSKTIVGNETEPVKVAQKIFDWITSTIPWASSREYSTMENIPSYILENGHGDCGMVTLLMLTLCRHNGIPAKWQSGFMLHPGSVNLHDWGEIYFEGTGWIPVDTSFGLRKIGGVQPFFLGGIDSYRWIVNEDYSGNLYPSKIYPRSETVDLQRGEVEWRGGNLYFNQWKWNIDCEEQ